MFSATPTVLALNDDDVSDKPVTIYTTPLTTQQADALRALLDADGFTFETKPYMRYFASRPRLNIAVYEKGPKAVVQGKDTQEFVQFRLEPEILGEAKLGYDDVHHPEKYEPHFGIDESGKGDFFGPLVIAGVFTDSRLAHEFKDAGIQDSKAISSDKRIRDLAQMIRRSKAAQTVITITPERYNALFAKIGNLNRLLAWGHARAIENLCEMRPDCPRALSDKFADVRVLNRALMEKGRGIVLDQQTKAESDFAVAAASILAREKFIDWMESTGDRLGCKMPRGASAAVKTTAIALVRTHGPDVLKEISKAHFKTTAEVLSAVG